MKLHQLRALTAISEARSIQGAARALNLTQPALSKAVLELERELGVPLLARSSRGATLTAYGRSILHHCRAIQHEVERIGEEVAALRNDWSGRLRLGIVPVAADSDVAGAIVAFRREHPSVALSLAEMRTAAIVEDIRDGRLDLGIISHPGPPAYPGLSASPLQSLDMMLVASAGAARMLARADTDAGPRALDDLTDHPWLFLDQIEEPGGYLATLFDQHAGRRPANIVRCTSPLLAYELASQLNILSCWTRRGFDGFVSTGTRPPLVPIPTVEPLPPLDLYLLYQDEALLTSASRRFARLLKA